LHSPAQPNTRSKSSFSSVSSLGYESVLDYVQDSTENMIYGNVDGLTPVFKGDKFKEIVTVKMCSRREQEKNMIKIQDYASRRSTFKKGLDANGLMKGRKTPKSAVL
jgi:hypothetical protein